MSNEFWNGAGDEPSVDEEFASSVLEREYQRRHLETRGREAAEVMIDLEQHGPLYQYMRLRRKQAEEAMLNLVDVSPGEPARIATLQASVREYLLIANWIEGVQQDGDAAAQEIEEVYGNGKEEQSGDYYGD